MKKILALVLALCLSLCGLTAVAEEQPVELIVFAAASMTETLTTLGDAYM